MSQRILITGARRGIGAAIAVGLARPGNTLLLHHLDAAAEAETVAGLCRDLGAQAELLDANLADANSVSDLAAQAGEVDVLINNAARASNVPFGSLPLGEWAETFAVNVTAPMLLAQDLSAGMAARGWGRIVNVVSPTVRMGGPSGPSYVASKAALIGLTRSLARSLGPLGITVNALSPGAIRTEGEAELAAGHDVEAHAPLVATQAIPRSLVPEDLVATVRLLVSDGAGALTGQVIEVGGGLVFR
ncbi:NAD(P)-dependent dehydrogenase (short-subunit alcohol dehydrogenase family) [Actinoplanes tereljensis]|uniref:Short-chain dehydrogenase/reductase n=1 Tax=Paractinoplanes tereljensis TaxID=571912 RepID=A0A919NQD5_9ACTN|nr:SDR family oxidoreductase [Actinoplanes tereljensis]GIF22408.1 short-chain dehydrogenase/reductase [Actinoplanes tereljensis]